MAALGGKKTVFLQARKLGGHCRTLNAQIVCQLLAVEGNVKFQTALAQRFRREIRQQLLARAALAHVGDLVVQLQILPRQHRDKIPDQQRVLRAGLRADGGNPLDVQKHDFGRHACDDADI